MTTDDYITLFLHLFLSGLGEDEEISLDEILGDEYLKAQNDYVQVDGVHQ